MTFVGVLAVTILTSHLLFADAQPMPQSLWKWPRSNSSFLPASPPQSSQNAEYNGINACGGGGDTHTSWSCPHMMLLSPDMQFAAQMDGYDSWAVYGVAGIGQASDCGKCFQLRINSGGSVPSKRFIIVQAANTGSDVSSGQFDILVGAGGFGIYDGCASDCQYGRVCSGGHCNAPQYSSGFSAWTPDGNCYGGGVRDANGCNALAPNPQTFAEKTLVYGCKEAIYQRYHQNLQVSFAQVQCPKSLYQITGIRPNSDTSLPLPNPSLYLPSGGRTTTTMDCCKPTCAWRQNVKNADSNWPQLFVCDKTGVPLMN